MKCCSHTPLSTKLKRQRYIKHTLSELYCCSQVVVLAGVSERGFPLILGEKSKSLKKKNKNLLKIALTQV